MNNTSPFSYFILLPDYESRHLLRTLPSPWQEKFKSKPRPPQTKKILSVQNIDKVARGGLDLFSEYPRPAASPLWVRGIQKTILALDKGWNFFRSRIQHLVRTLSRRNLSKPCHDIVKTNLTNLIDKACFEMLIYGRSCNFNIFILGPLRPR